VSDTGGLERGYQRLLACYPRGFRREHEEEMLAVLMAGIRGGQRRPGLAESGDLLRNALWLRLRTRETRPPRAVASAVRLMYVGALLELTALITIIASTASVKAAILAKDPNFTASQWHAVLTRSLVPDELVAPVAAGLWLVMARAHRRGYRWARPVFTGFFAISAFGLFISLAHGAARYASADLIAGVALCVLELAVFTLIFNDESHAHYRRDARRG
jgi:hypothetical protein